MPNTAVFDANADGNTKVSQLVPPAFVASIWRSPWVDVTAFRRLNLICRADQPFAADGVVIEQSDSANPAADSDADYWTSSGTEGTSLETQPVTGVQNYRVAMSVERIGLFARLVVKHGASVPTAFKAKLVGAGIT